MAITAADIDRVYNEVLGRAADRGTGGQEGGFEFYSKQPGLTSSDLANILRGSSEYSSNLARASAASSGGNSSAAVPNLTVVGETASTPVVGPTRPSGSSGASSVEIPQPGNLALLSSNLQAAAAPNDYSSIVSGAYGALGRSGFGTGATEIDQRGFDYWKSQLESGAITPEDFKTAFSAAATGTSPEEIVARTYGTYGRAGLGTDTSQIDPGGFKYWTNQLQSGQLTPTDFAQKFSYDMVKDQQFGNTKGADVHKYFYDNQKNPFAVLDYAVKQGLQGEDLAKATGLSMNQIREYFGPVYNPIGAPIDKPGQGAGGQYGSINGMPILNRGLVDNILGAKNTSLSGDLAGEDNNIGWDTASFNSTYAQGPAAFGINRVPMQYGGGFKYEGDMNGLAKSLGINVDDFVTKTVTSPSGMGQTTTNKVLDQDALYDALSSATKDFYRVTGASGMGRPDAAIQRPDVSGNHASVLYRAYNDKLVPVGDPSYFNAAMVNKDPGLLAFVPAVVSFMFPGIGTAIGQALSLKGATAAVVGNAIYGAAASALVGGDPIKGAVTGGVGGAAGFYAPEVAANVLGAGDEVAGAARIGQLAQAAGMTTKQVSEIVSGSLAGGVNAAIVGGQDPLEAFALTLAASFTGTKAKQLVGDFKKDFKKADFDKATLYAANAADSVTRSLISGGDVAQNLLADMGDTRQQIEDVFAQPKTPGVGTQVGPALASLTDVDLRPYLSPSDYDEQGNLRIEVTGTADDIAAATTQREQDIRSLFGLGTPDPDSPYSALFGGGATGDISNVGYSVFAIDQLKKPPQQVIIELENWKTQADTPEKKAEIDKAISKVRYIDAAARSDQVDPAEIVRKEFQTELDEAKKVVEDADREVQKVVKEEPIKESPKDSEVKAESPDTKTEKPAKTEATDADKEQAESSGATIISPGAGGTTQVADSTVAGGSTSGGGAEAGGGTTGVPKAQADTMMDQLYAKAGFQDPEGAKWWSNQLTSGAMTPEFVAKAFAEELPQNEIVIKPGGDTTGTTTTTGGGAAGLTVTGGEATGPYQTDGATGTSGTGGTGGGAGTGSGTVSGGGAGTGGTGSGDGTGTGSGQGAGTGTGDGTGQGTGSGSGQGAGTGEGTGEGTGSGEGTGGQSGGSGGSGQGAGAGTGTGTTGTDTGGTGGASGGSGPKPEIETPEKPISLPQISLPSDPIGAPPTREWFDKFLTSSLTTGAFKSVFDPVTQTEQLVEPVSKEDEEMMLPSREAGTPEATIEELIALLTGGEQPSFYTYGSSDEDEDIAPPSGLPLKKGGLAAFRNGGDVMAAPLMAATGGVPHKGSHYVQGAGGGQDDLIEARLADGEYVFDADIVAALGDGSNAEGARKLDKMREAIRKHKRSAPNDKIPPKAKSPLAYLKEVS